MQTQSYTKPLYFLIQISPDMFILRRECHSFFLKMNNNKNNITYPNVKLSLKSFELMVLQEIHKDTCTVSNGPHAKFHGYPQPTDLKEEKKTQHKTYKY